MSVAVKLDDETRGILSRMTVTGNVARLPPGNLDRPIYEKVNKALTAIGGRWNRSQGGHVFPKDPTDLLRGGVEQGAVENLKQKFQFFETPTVTADEMAELAGVCPGMNILEPSAGHGRIALAARNRGGNVATIDINPDCVERLRELRFLSTVGDFLTMTPRSIYDAVILNPPFSRKQAIEHICMAWCWVRPGGRIVAICDPGSLSNGSRVEREFQDWLRALGFRQKELPAGTFSSSGTEVRSWLLWATK